MRDMFLFGVQLLGSGLAAPSMRDTFLFGGQLLGSGLAAPGMRASVSYGRDELGHRSEVGLAVVLRGLTRGLTRVVLWLRVVVLQDPHVFVDTHFRPMAPLGTSSLWEHTKSGLYVPGHLSKFRRLSQLGTSSLWDHPTPRWDVWVRRIELSLSLAHRRRTREQTRKFARVGLYRDPAMVDDAILKF
jgi:hypothetical protein